jgi:hypothetical protein
MTTILEIEVLNGPLDGVHLKLETEADWTRLPGSILSFPWDDELGEPQARFIPDEQGWQMEPIQSKRGTHLLREGEEVQLPTTLQAGDILKASSTWLMVNKIT